MQSKATTVAAYLASLPADRRAALEAVRQVILKNLDKDYSEGMQYGMIGYAVPHSVFPAGYHCDPKQPLPFAGLASQKNHMSLYLMCVYGDLGPNDLHAWFVEEWARTGKKLDMGKACIRFKRVEDLALDVIGATIRRVPAKVYIEHYVRVRDGAKGGATRPAAKKAAKSAKKQSREPAASKARSQSPKRKVSAARTAKTARKAAR